MRLIGRSVSLAIGLSAGVAAATEYTAWLFRWPAAFGSPFELGGAHVYLPFSYLVWRNRFGSEYPHAWTGGVALILVGLALGAAASTMFDEGGRSPRRTRGWGRLADARRAGLLRDSGCVLGRMGRRLLTTEDLRPTLVTGGTRSGKGRGHVVPSLLSWAGSVLVHDPKGELWRTTAGWRGQFSHALYFNARDLASARCNVLATVRPGSHEVADIQRLVAILSDPGGARDDEAIWDRAASEILEAVILHVLCTAEDDRKTLVEVAGLLANLDATAKTMLKTLHVAGPHDEPVTHPFIDRAVRGYSAMHDRFRTSVQGTARSYLKWVAGADVEHAVSGHDFTFGDLMCAKAPVSLYIQVSPADQAALRPLIRLMFYAAAQALTAHETTDASGREKRHKLLMVMDEFPLLGRLEFFEKSLRLMSGYGLKAMLAAQSLNDIAETYGPHNTIMDNCFAYTAFSALDPTTQDKVSKLTGSVAEPRQSRSGPAGLSAGRSSVSHSTADRPLLEPGEIRALGDHEQLTFIAGHRPLRTKKVRYDKMKPFKARAAIAPPDQARRLDAPPRTPHPWAGRRALGFDESRQLNLFPEQQAAMASKEAADRFAAEQAATDATIARMHARDGFEEA